jgi:hypothetical protein
MWLHIIVRAEGAMPRLRSRGQIGAKISLTTVSRYASHSKRWSLNGGNMPVCLNTSRMAPHAVSRKKSAIGIIESVLLSFREFAALVGAS